MQRSYILLTDLGPYKSRLRISLAISEITVLRDQNSFGYPKRAAAPSSCSTSA